MSNELLFPHVTTEAPEVIERANLATYPIARLHLLGHGEMTTAVTILGEGFTKWRDLDVHRFREEACLEAGGIYFYLRDRDRVWSAGFRPTGARPDVYQVSFAIDHVEITRRDGDIETTTEIAVSPERPAEVRRLTLVNHGTELHEIEVTTSTEIVLTQRDADLAHRAFASMFLDAEALPDRNAILVRRRARSDSEQASWVVQVLSTEGEGWLSPLEYETSRARFIGRGRTTADPVGLHAPLESVPGAVLDPLIAMRHKVRLEPGSRARVTLTTALATSRAQALELVDTCAPPRAIARTFALARTEARAELERLGIRPAQSHMFQRLLSAVVFPNPGLRGEPRFTDHGGGRETLWAQGLSDLPIVAVRIDDADSAGLFGEVLLAHELWRRKGMEVDLVAIDEHSSDDVQPHDTLASLIRSNPAAYRLDQRGGIFLRRARDLTDEELALIMLDARVVLRTSRGSLAKQLRQLAKKPDPRPFVPTRAPTNVESTPLARPALLLDNGYGGLAQDGRYVMTVRATDLPPMPWCNVMANPSFGALVSESGSSTTWSLNSQQHRLTPWSNDPIGDPSGETLYVRDDETGSSWSATPLPAGGDAHYLVEHGQGWSSFAHTRGGLAHRLTVNVHPTDSIKTWLLTIENQGERPRRLSLTMLAEWVLGPTRDQSRVSVMTKWNDLACALLANNPLSLFPERHAFLTAAGAAIGSYSGDREEVFGDLSASRAHPAFLDRVELSKRVGSGLDPCAALQVKVTIEPGKKVKVAFLLGEAEDVDTARELVEKHRDLARCEQSLVETKQSWDRMLDAVVIKTPDVALDLLANHWLLYQVASCRLFGRTAFYQSGGAYGFRDQIQDVLALVHTRPDLTREHILRAAARQFIEGDVQHWWYANEGVRTRFSDDLLWLPFAVAEYVRVTGDSTLLDERVTFLKERALTEKDEDLFSSPAITEEKATIYEHCTRALDRGATRGVHGLPKMGSGDWNDGMNRVGRGGKGESVWLAWFLATTAHDFAPIAEQRGDHERVRMCKALIDELARAVEQAWDGSWYRRAYFDDGTPLGTRDSAECRIDAIAQSWSVIAGIGDPVKAREAVESSERELVNKQDRFMRLLTPPFVKAEPDPGYIRSYPAGIRENGGQYTHGVLWTVQALALLGEGDRALGLLSMLNPLNHARTREEVARYQVEPYVVAADVYDAPGHVGRGGWTWYSGAASVMYRLLLQNILGVQREGDTLRINPCISREWKRFEVTYRDGEGAVHVVVENPKGVQRGVERIEVDGRAIDAIKLTGKPGTREVHVVMG